MDDGHIDSKVNGRRHEGETSEQKTEDLGETVECVLDLPDEDLERSGSFREFGIDTPSLVSSNLVTGAQRSRLRPERVVLRLRKGVTWTWT